MKVHELKIYPRWFADVMSGKKNFEIRKNDRDFKVGDFIRLKEYTHGEYTGKETQRKIEYIFEGDGYGLEKGYCVLGLQPTNSVTVNMNGNNNTQIGYIHSMVIE